MKNKKVYLAGPDVFRPYASSHFETMKKILSLHYFDGLAPIDGSSNDPEQIYNNNLQLISNSDYVLANLDTFRGASADAGTCVEIGFAYAMYKPIIGYYTNGKPKEYKTRVKKKYKESKYTHVEDFSFTDNLMIIKSCIDVCNSFHDAVNILWHYDMKIEKEKNDIYSYI